MPVGPGQQHRAGRGRDRGAADALLPAAEPLRVPHSRARRLRRPGARLDADDQRPDRARLRHAQARLLHRRPGDPGPTTAPGAGAGTTPELAGNAAPTLAIEGGEARTVRAGEPLELVAVSTDDGKPPRPFDARLEPAPSGPLHDRHPPRGTACRGSSTAAPAGWSFDPPQIKVWEDTRDTGQSPWSPGWGDPAGSRGRPLGRAGDVRRARRLRAARHHARRRVGHDGGRRRHRHPPEPRASHLLPLRPPPAPGHAGGRRRPTVPFSQPLAGV